MCVSMRVQVGVCHGSHWRSEGKSVKSVLFSPLGYQTQVMSLVCMYDALPPWAILPALFKLFFYQECQPLSIWLQINTYFSEILCDFSYAVHDALLTLVNETSFIENNLSLCACVCTHARVHVYMSAHVCRPKEGVSSLELEESAVSPEILAVGARKQTELLYKRSRCS